MLRTGLRSSNSFFSNLASTSTSAVSILLNSIRNKSDINFSFQLNQKQRCFDVNIDVDFDDSNNQENKKNFFAKVPFVFLADHSTTLCEPSTLQRSIAINYQRDQCQFEFDSKGTVNHLHNVVQFYRTHVRPPQKNNPNNNLYFNENSQEDLDAAKHSLIVVPFESFLQLISARVGQRRNDAEAAVTLYASLEKIAREKKQRAHEELQKQVPKSSETFAEIEKDENRLRSIRIAQGLTKAHFRLAVSHWLRNYNSVAPVCQEASSGSNNQKQKVVVGNIHSARFHPSSPSSKTETTTSSSSNEKVPPLVQNVFSKSIQDFVSNLDLDDDDGDNNNIKQQQQTEMEREKQMQTELLQLLSSAENSQRREEKTKQVVRELDEHGFVIVDDPVLKLGLPCPVSLSVAEEPTGVPSSGLVYDLANHPTSKLAHKVVERRNATEFLLKYIFGVLMNSHYGVTPIWGSFEGKKKKKINQKEEEYKQEKKNVVEKESDASSTAIDHLDTAYLTVGIDLHTDATYSHSPPKLQGFGLIHWDDNQSRGGKNVLVDGLDIANEMLSGTSSSSSSYFWTLCKNTVPAYYAKDGRAMAGFRPVFALCPSSSSSSPASSSPILHVTQVSYNAYDRAPLILCEILLEQQQQRERSESEQKEQQQQQQQEEEEEENYALEKMKEFYEAYTQFAVIAKGNNNNNNNEKNPSKTLATRFQPQLGQILIFDNHRCLHARTAFEGPRIMCGSYVASDDYISALNKFELE